MTLVETVYCDVSAATKLEGSLKMLGQCSKYEGFGQTTNEKMKSVSTAKTKSNDIAVWILNTTFVFNKNINISGRATLWKVFTEWLIWCARSFGINEFLSRLCRNRNTEICLAKYDTYLPKN